MPGAATITQPAPSAQATPVGAVSPFPLGSTEHVESFLNTTLTPTTNGQPVGGGPVDVLAYGYLRNIVLLVTASGGTGSAAVYQADAPWTTLQEVAVLDTNGGQIYGPTTGYNLFLQNLLGGHAFVQDPQQLSTWTVGTTAGNFQFSLRIPFEIGRRDAIGSLPNMNASQTYKLRVVLAPLIDIYSTNPTGIPTIQIQAFTEAWSPPSPTGPNGEVQAVQPPNLGTTQFVTVQRIPVASSGQSALRLSRTGGMIRNYIFVGRTAANVRSNTVLPTFLVLTWDGRVMFSCPTDLLRQYCIERTGIGPTALPTGVVAYSFCHDFDGKTGDEMREQYLRSTAASRIELAGNFGASGTLECVTDDITPVGSIFPQSA